MNILPRKLILQILLSSVFAGALGGYALGELTRNAATPPTIGALSP